MQNSFKYVMKLMREMLSSNMWQSGHIRRDYVCLTNVFLTGFAGRGSYSDIQFGKFSQSIFN